MVSGRVGYVAGHGRDHAATTRSSVLAVGIIMRVEFITGCENCPPPPTGLPLAPRSHSTLTTEIRRYAFGGHSGHPQEKRSGWLLEQDLPSSSQLFPDTPPRFVSPTHSSFFLIQT